VTAGGGPGAASGGDWVTLYGPVGVGKSHIAQVLAHLAIRAGAEARFVKTSRVLAHLAGGQADRTGDRRLAELTRPAVLVLDFGMREGGDGPRRKGLPGTLALGRLAQRRGRDDLGKVAAARSDVGYRPTWLTAYSAWASVKPSPALDVSCWIRLARLNPPSWRYPWAASTAWAFQSGCR